jgi:hypothetical protein
MTHTRTVTVEEMALEALCDQRPRCIAYQGICTKGRVVAISAAEPDSERPDLRYVTVTCEHEGTAPNDVKFILPLLPGVIYSS